MFFSFNMAFNILFRYCCYKNGYFKKVDVKVILEEVRSVGATAECLLYMRVILAEVHNSRVTVPLWLTFYYIYDTAAAVRVMYTCICSTIFLQYALCV